MIVTQYFYRIACWALLAASLAVLYPVSWKLIIGVWLGTFCLMTLYHVWQNPKILGLIIPTIIIPVMAFLLPLPLGTLPASIKLASSLTIWTIFFISLVALFFITVVRKLQREG